MRQTTSILFSFCLILLSLVACKDNAPSVTDTLQYVPASSSSVTSVNLERLMKKADFDQVKNMEFYEELLRQAKEENACLAAIMADPYSSGVDLTKNIYIASEISEENLEDSKGAITFTLADVSAFETTLGKAEIPDAEARTGFKWIELNRNGGVAYNDGIGMIVFSSKRNQDLAAYAQSIMETTPETSISQNSDLQDLLGQDHDLLSWTSLDAIGKNPDVKFGTSMAGIPAEALEGNTIRSYADFLNGEVVSESNFFLKKELTRDVDLLFKNEVKTDFSPFIPGENNLFAFAAALDVEGLNQVLKERPQFKGFADYQLKEYGLSLDDLVATLQGDLMLSAYGERSAMNGIFATKLKDKKKMQTFLDIADEFDLLEKDGSLYQLKANSVGEISVSIDLDGYLFIHDGILFATADRNLIDQIKGGGISKGDRLSKEALSQLNSHIFGTYVNGQTIDNLVDEIDFSGVQDFLLSLDRKDSEAKIRFSEKNQNSLKTIFELFNQAYLKGKAKDGIEM